MFYVQLQIYSVYWNTLNTFSSSEAKGEEIKVTIIILTVSWFIAGSDLAWGIHLKENNHQIKNSLKT